jgi:hypothetical protein
MGACTRSLVLGAGPRHVRAVYAPALVGWVGSPGLNVSISVGGGGGVGWFPLGPREVYVPYRRYSQRYVERVNVHNTVIVNRTIINNVYEHGERNVTYRNRGVPGGVTAVSRSTFTSAERVGDRRIRDERQFAGRGSTAVAPRIDPVRESRLGSGDTRRFVRAPPQAVIAREVVVKRNPPPSSAHFTRSVGQPAAPRAQADRTNRGSDRPGNEWRNRARPDNSGTGTPVESARVQDSRPAPNDREVRDGRTPYRQRTDRPERANQPRTQVVAPQSQQPQAEQQRAIAVQQQESRQREQSERQQQGRELQERRRAEVQVREPREQQQSVRERPVRAPQVEQPRAPQQAQPKEQRERPAPQKPAADPPQRQRDDNDYRGRGERNDRR